jgi:hypothetical protein
LAIFTAALAMASFWTIREARRASGEQLGVQTWLYLDPRSDSKELTHARKNLAEQLDHDILEFLEDVGSLYNRNLLNEELARSSFSWEAIRWWEVAKVYIADERRAITMNLCTGNLMRSRKPWRNTSHVSVRLI